MNRESLKSEEGTTEKLEQCLALVDFHASQEDEISFKKNDLIRVTSKVESSGFWKGYVLVSGGATPTRKEGLFPMCFITSHPHAVLSVYGLVHFPQYYSNRALCVDTCMIVENGEERVCERGEVVTLLQPAKQLFNHWLVRIEDGRPKTKVTSACCPFSKLSCNVVVVVHDFIGSHPSQLSLRSGETVLVHRRWNDGWWEGSVIHRDDPGKDRRGVFPSSFTVPNVCTTSPQAFCNECKGFIDATNRKCQRCSANGEVVEQMVRALKEYHAERSAGQMDSKVDVFKYLSIRSKEATSKSYESSTRILL